MTTAFNRITNHISQTYVGVVDKVFREIEFKAHRGVLVTGSTGVGKTTLIQNAFHVTKAAPTNDNGEFMSTTELVDYNGSLDDRTLVLTDSPGDMAGRKILIDGVKPMIDGTKIQGIINIVAAGYSNTTSVEGSVNFDDEYRRKKISDDILYLVELFDSITNLDGHVWFLTVVNKRDKWNENIDGKGIYDRGSEYYDVISKFKLMKGVTDCIASTYLKDDGFEELYDSLRRLTRSHSGNVVEKGRDNTSTEHGISIGKIKG